MTFNQVAMKNFMVHARRYLSFFICSSCAVTILFMYSNLMYNKEISQALDNTTKDMLKASVIAVIVFAVFFLGYAYSSFMKSRNREMALFKTLGMTSADLSTLMRIENIVITVSSLIAGLISGTLFSRIFFMVVQEILNLNTLQFKLHVEEYVFTLVVFLSVSMLIMLWGRRKSNKLELSELLKYDRSAEKSYVHHPVLAILGLSLIILSYVIKFGGVVHIKESSTVFTMVCFTGLYWFITQTGESLLKLCSSMKRLYYRNILAINELRHKLVRSKMALYIITLLSALIMFFVGTAYSTYLTKHGSQQQEGMMLLFISIFLALLFFAATGCIIYFKLFSEVEDEKAKYQDLSNVGITKKEVQEYISLELKVLFFAPMVVGFFLAFPYMFLENAKSNELREILLYSVFVDVIYMLFQSVLYKLVKYKYIKEIMCEN